MRKVIVALLFFPLANLFAVEYPNHAFTPGEANPILTKEKICAREFRTSTYRNVPTALKKVENYLHKEVCEGLISLEEAQKEISGDWYAVYVGMVKR